MLKIALAMLIAGGMACGQPGPKSQQVDPDAVWASKSGLTVADIRSLRAAIGIPDTPSSRSINAIDANSLKLNSHILVVEFQRACLVLHVFERAPSGFKEVWSLDHVPSINSPFGPKESAQSQRICAQAPIPPRVHGTMDARIVLEIPVLADPSQRSIPPYVYSFTWDGNAYTPDTGR
jgi:hypothetical protein